jgi:cation transport ATPase
MVLIVGIWKGASQEILIRHGEPLELFRKIDIDIFDKKGTLTEGNLVVSEVYWKGGINTKEMASVLPAVQGAFTYILTS